MKLVAVKVPEGNADAGGFNAEAGAFFDELIRSGGDKKMTNPGRANSFRTSRLTPAVEYLQGQRARAMMMAKLAEAVAEVDVYLVPANSGGGGGGGRGRGGGAAGGVPRPASAARHFNMANIAGYPAISVPHGFAESGSPTALTFYGPPFAEREILQLAKAYQDASGFHLKHPGLDAAAPAPKSM